jgi:hypothetical protein
MVASSYPTVSPTLSSTGLVCPADGHYPMLLLSQALPRSLPPAVAAAAAAAAAPTGIIPPPKRVTFFVDELDRDLVEVLEYDAALECCDKAGLYWSDDEKTRFRNDAWLKVQDFVARYPDRAQQVEAVFLHCHANNSGRAPQSEKEIKDDMRVLMLWAHSSGRGLEDSVTSLFHEERQRYIQNLLHYSQALGEYAAMKEHDQVINVPEELRYYSEEQTHRSREFAFKLAVADELTQS